MQKKILQFAIILSLFISSSVQAQKEIEYKKLNSVLKIRERFIERDNNKINSILKYPMIETSTTNKNYNIFSVAYYLLAETKTNFKFKKLQLNISVENILNKYWNAVEFDTESKSFKEINAVTEYYYATGNAFFIKTGIAFNF